LGPDDLFCAKCGRPTPLNVDPEATVRVDEGAEDSGPLDARSGLTTPARPSEASAPPPDAPFKARLRYVLRDEFEILKFIGQGGFARVYRARDRRLDRIVAIKVIRPEMVGTELFMESFRNEGIALAKLRHPGIVPIYDIRERGGLIYYIMPLLQGTTLEARLGQGRLSPYESRRILSELADALWGAHREKMVHLDIKPDNVFLEGDLQKVLLVDFGIARAVTETVPESSGEPIVGTPAYMSPEQAQGLPDIDHRSDIYSLGVLGYHMVMGRPPFSGRNAEEVLRKHIEEAPVPIRKINPSIPKDFADAIMRCLEKDPWDRFPTARELSVALESVTFFSPQGETTPDETSSGMDRNWVAVIAGAALLIGLLIGTVIG
jgi:serine/threonine-protein kinase